MTDDERAKLEFVRRLLNTAGRNALEIGEKHLKKTTRATECQDNIETRLIDALGVLEGLGIVDAPGTPPVFPPPLGETKT